jgi:hypothetical protein
VMKEIWPDRHGCFEKRRSMLEPHEVRDARNFVLARLRLLPDALMQTD